MDEPRLQADDEDTGPFKVCKTAGEVFALAHRMLGDDDLKELIEMMDDGDLSSEFLTEAADELQQAGLKLPAAIVMEIAATKPSGIEFNPYEPSDTLNWKAWRQSWTRRQKIKSGQLEADLRRQHSRKTRKH